MKQVSRYFVRAGQLLLNRHFEDGSKKFYVLTHSGSSFAFPNLIDGKK
jgi:hypothetical protein